MENQFKCNFSFRKPSEQHCSLSPTCKGWGCKFLTTPIDHIHMTNQEKAKLFVRVYREAKQKGVLECPYYRSSIIDEVLDNVDHLELLAN